MLIFVDLDDTLYQTNVETCGTVAEILIAELLAPMFDHAKETLEKFHKDGYECWVVTARGLISDEEIDNTKIRLRQDGLTHKGKDSVFYGMVNPCRSKYSGIKNVYNNAYHKEVDTSDCVLIDNDPEAIFEAAENGVPVILFNPDDIEFDEETTRRMGNLPIKTAHSWQEIEKIVDEKDRANRNAKQEIPPQIEEDTENT